MVGDFYNFMKKSSEEKTEEEMLSEGLDKIIKVLLILFLGMMLIYFMINYLPINNMNQYLVLSFIILIPAIIITRMRGNDIKSSTFIFLTLAYLIFITGMGIFIFLIFELNENIGSFKFNPYAIIFTVFYVSILYYVYKSGSLYKRFLNTMKYYGYISGIPSSKIKTAPQGLNKFVGRAITEKPLISPVSKTECIYYKVVVERYADRKYVKVYEKEKSVPFKLLDDTGKAVVYPKDAKVYTETEKTFLGYDISRKYIPNFSPKIWSKVMDREEKITEYVLKNNSIVTVVGSVYSTSGNTIIKKGELDKTFVIVEGDEKEAIKRIKKAIFKLIFSFAVILLGLIYIITKLK